MSNESNKAINDALRARAGRPETAPEPVAQVELPGPAPTPSPGAQESFTDKIRSAANRGKVRHGGPVQENPK